MGIKNMRAICPNCGGKIHTQPKGLLGAVAIGANGWLVQTGSQCEHCGARLTGKVTMQNYAVLDLDAPPPAASAPVNETRDAYLERINARPAPPPPAERCHVLGGGKQCGKAEGHQGAHDFSKKAAKAWVE